MLSGLRTIRLMGIATRGVWLPPQLLDTQIWYDPSDLTSAFSDTGGTTPVTNGDTLALALDKSSLGNHITQATAAYRPSVVVDADGTFWQHDQLDDALTVTGLGSLGAACTVAYVTRSEVRLLEDQTVTDTYTLPAQEIAGFVLVDRALTFAEKVQLIRYLASKVQGVSYGAEIDRMTLIAVNAVDVLSWTEAVSGYPNQMIIVAESAAVKIYDATDPALPLHSTLDFTGYTVTALDMASGVLSVGTTTGLAVFNLADGDTTVALDYTTATTPAIVNSAVNDVAMTVRPDAPIDGTTGLQVPTIAVATDGNGTYSTSVITDSGTVYDIANDSTGTAVSVAFDGVSLSAVRSDGTVYVWDDVGAIAADGVSPDATYSASSTPALLGTVSRVAA